MKHSALLQMLFIWFNWSINVRFNYDCVIYGWDHFCDMPLTWKHQMGVFALPNGAKQPFYNVLANDGSNRYAAQGKVIENHMV